MARYDLNGNLIEIEGNSVRITARKDLYPGSKLRVLVKFQREVEPLLEQDLTASESTGVRLEHRGDLTFSFWTCLPYNAVFGARTVAKDRKDAADLLQEVFGGTEVVKKNCCITIPVG